uniref:Uncharacterized protein n=1 Tax=Nelumbo nucifera TaxID=4432 RepID=A0A822YCI2_NELNU|nr:TPA_asm: hypothetical protein HUJ06_031500 [Nelumbo nucifera]
MKKKADSRFWWETVMSRGGGEGGARVG